MLAFKDGARVRLISRQGVDHTARFGELAAALAALRAPELVLDGEVCVFDEDLISQFHLLGHPHDVIATLPVYMAFDCLHAVGLDVRGLPLHRRRRILEAMVSAPLGGASLLNRDGLLHTRHAPLRQYFTLSYRLRQHAHWKAETVAIRNVVRPMSHQSPLFMLTHPRRPQSIFDGVASACYERLRLGRTDGG